MSLAQLLQVKLPELSAPLLVEQKAPEKPSEDFLVVLDRALNDTDANSRPISQDKPPSEQTEYHRTEASPNEIARSDAARYESQRADAASQSRENVSANAKGKISEKQIDPRGQSEHTVATLAKNRDHAANVEKSHTLQKDSTKPKGIDSSRTDNAHLVAFNQSGAGEVQRQTDARQAQISKKSADIPQLASETTTDHKSRKIFTKTGKLAASADHNKKPTTPVLASTTPGNKNAKTLDPRLEAAASRMQLHADTGSGPKSLQGALDIVKDIAKTLGIGSAEDPSKTAGKTVDLSRNLSFASTTAKTAAIAKNDREDSAHSKKAEGTLSLRQSDRIGRKGAHEVLAQARESGRVQVLDMRSAGMTGSPVLENLLSAQNGLSSGDSRSKESGRKDSFTVLNSSYMPASPITNSVTIPMHLVANQGSNLQQSIRNHLIEKSNNEIVQQARIIMRGQDSGEIRLILKPEALGEVRIHLHMNDGHIAGQIFVENKEVQAAFQDNMDALMQAFQDGGLSTGSMQVAVDSKGSGQQGFNFQERENDEQQKRYAVGRIEHSVAASAHDYNQINLVV